MENSSSRRVFARRYRLTHRRWVRYIAYLWSIWRSNRLLSCRSRGRATICWRPPRWRERLGRSSSRWSMTKTHLLYVSLTSSCSSALDRSEASQLPKALSRRLPHENGRAPCRERVLKYVLLQVVEGD